MRERGREGSEWTDTLRPHGLPVCTSPLPPAPRTVVHSVSPCARELVSLMESSTKVVGSKLKVQAVESSSTASPVVCVQRMRMNSVTIRTTSDDRRTKMALQRSGVKSGVRGHLTCRPRGASLPDEGHADLSSVREEALVACQEGEEEGKDCIEGGDHDRQNHALQLDWPAARGLRGEGGRGGGRARFKRREGGSNGGREGAGKGSRPPDCTERHRR